MRSALQVLTLALSLAVLSVSNLSAQPPLDPYPTVELQEVFAVGPDLAATFNWSNDVTPPPPGAQLKLLDSQGLEASIVNFVPLYGSQTIWIPGGATPRAGDESTSSLTRHIEIVSQPSRLILLEKALAIDPHGPVVILAPIWPLPVPDRHCFLYVESLTCDDSEDYGGDEIYFDLGVNGATKGPSGVRGGDTVPLGWLFLTCNTCLSYEHPVKIDLWDLDDSIIGDSDDFLGSSTLGGCTAVPPTSVKYSGSNYTYWLKYRVLCYEVDCG